MTDYNTKATNSGMEFEKVPAGSYQAICIGVYGLGLQKFEARDNEGKTKEKIQEKVRLVWEVNKRDAEKSRFLISKTYNLSTHQNSALRADMEGWRGKAFTEQEIEEFDVSVVNGVQCLLTVIHNQNYVNVKSVSPVPEGMPDIIQEQQVPEGMLKKINETREKAVTKPTQSTVQQCVAAALKDAEEDLNTEAVPF